MSAFSEQEQIYSDLDWFAIDKGNRIAHFTTVGGRLLPPTVAESKEELEMLFNYFSSLPIEINAFESCPTLQKSIETVSIPDFDQYIDSFAKMSMRGLYSFDSYDTSSSERPYFQVTCPQNELLLESLPEKIQIILNHLKFYEISFAETFIISNELANSL